MTSRSRLRSCSSLPPPVTMRKLSSSRQVTVSSAYTCSTRGQVVSRCPGVQVVTLPPWVSMWHSTVRPGLGTAPAVATSSSCAESGPVRENLPKLETGVDKDKEVDTCLVDIYG